MSSFGTVIFAIAVWGPVLAYLPLQIAALLYGRGQIRIAGFLPIPFAGITGFITTSSFVQNSNLWPCCMFGTAPLADVYLIGLIVAEGQLRRSDPFHAETEVERRRRRGLCPACAYPIGSSPVCTECGVALKLRNV